MSDKHYVDESLARGLTNRFFNEMSELSKRCESKFHGLTPKISDRSSFVKYIDKLKQTFNDVSLIDYEGGSKGQPYYSLDLLQIYNERVFNGWRERCLFGNTFIFSYSPRYFDSVQARYNFGEHAIFRLYCRTPSKFVCNTIDYKYIIKQMIQVPMWSNCWLMRFFANENIGVNMRVILPAHSGIFIAHIEPSIKTVEIRTFVGDSQLSEKQYIVKNILFKIGQNYIKSPLSFYLPISSSMIDFPSLVEKCLCYEIFNSTEFRNIKDIVFEQIEDDDKRIKSKNTFENSIFNEIKKLSPKIVEELKNDIRGSLVKFKTGHFQHLHDHPNGHG